MGKGNFDKYEEAEASPVDTDLSSLGPRNESSILRG
jgi:hypothetical protein